MKNTNKIHKHTSNQLKKSVTIPSFTGISMYTYTDDTW